MKGLSREEVAELRKKCPVGTLICIEEMKDEKHAPPKGATGIVKFIDDIGDIHVDWDDYYDENGNLVNGGSLAIIPNVDIFDIIA